MKIQVLYVLIRYRKWDVSLRNPLGCFSTLDQSLVQPLLYVKNITKINSIEILSHERKELLLKEALFEHKFKSEIE